MPLRNRIRNFKSSSNNRNQPVQNRSRIQVNKLSQRKLNVKRRSLRRANVKAGAENKLKNFRQASILAVALTGFILLLFSPGEAGIGPQDTLQQNIAPDSVAVIDKVAVEDLVAAESETLSVENIDGPSGKEAADEAITALQSLWNSFYYNLPKMLIALGALVLAWLISRLLRWLLHKTMRHWHSANATISLVTISVWLFFIGVAFSVVAGDIRALVGSFGLIGLALSWSLQTPIESFTGWLLNSFQGYYRVGDRIRVGEVFGDVYRIDFLTTTVWEIGAPYQPGFVQAEQPTGRLVTFPNNEILSGTVINLTGDFPYVWDELSVAVANESDIQLAMEVLEQTALNLLGNYMVEPSRQYAKLLHRANLGNDIVDKPQVFLSLEDSWTNITIRYLVGARERRKWKTELIFRVNQELNKPEYAEKIIPVYPRQQVQFINPDGVPVDKIPFNDKTNQ